MLFTTVFLLTVVMLRAAEHESKGCSDSIVIYANSSRRSSGITPQFTINLTRPISQIKSFEILGVEIPYSFYNVRKGNVGLADVTVNGTDYTFNHGNLQAILTVPESLIFVDSSDIIMIKIDGRVYSIPFIRQYGVPGTTPIYYHVNYSINQAGLGLLCTTTIIDYKLNFNITTQNNFTKIGFYLNGTTTNMAKYLGLTQDAEIINLQPTNTTNILMPSTYRIFNPLDLDLYTDTVNGQIYNVGGNNYYLTGVRHVNYYTTYFLQYFISGVGVFDYPGTVTVDPEKHYIGYLLGFNGSYSNMQLATNKITIPIKPPKYYDNTFLILLDYNAMGQIHYQIIVPDGNYNPTTLAAYITNQLALIPELATSYVSATSAGYLSITIITQSNHQSIRFEQYKSYGWSFLLNRMGFADLMVDQGTYWRMEIAGTNITTATFTATKPFNYRPTHLYIRSEALALLTSDSTTFTDDSTYQLDSLIHKICINTSPGGVIKDDRKYQTKRYTTRSLRSPLTQIDFSLYDEDGQLVQLNGRSWSIGIKIEF